MVELLPLVIALPLAGAVFLHFFGRRIGEPLAGWIATLAIGASFVVGVSAAFAADLHHAEIVAIWDWMPAIGGKLEIQWDALAVLMTLVVTGVGTLIHIFAIGYMHGDERFSRFFTYLNLFAASMLTLVLAGNFAMLFMGWELVGLCSYLLISFWYTKPSAAAAGKKAFIVNRIGDLGFMIALMIIFLSFGTLSYEGIFERAPEVLSTATATAIGLLLLVGAAGKSAQVPLYVWLPDAMEGPTPVVGTHPRRHHGDGRRVPGRPLRRHLRPRSRCRLYGGDHRCDHGDLGGLDRHRPDRHQEGARLLDRVASSATCSSPPVSAATSPRCSTS